MANLADSQLIGNNQSSPVKQETRPMNWSAGNIVKEPIKRFLKWFASSKKLALVWRIFSRPVLYAIESNGAVVVSYDDPDRKKIIDLIRQIKREHWMLVFDNEAYQIFMAVKRTERINGDLAEVGVYQGGTAKLIREANGNKVLHLFDTFQG